MKKHTKIYLQEMGFDTTDWIPCELCGKTAVDVHHLQARGQGGSKTKDNIENLMAVCRDCHIEYGDKKQYKGLLQATHIAYMRRRKTK